ncbi:hypothetical protein, partial [Aeromonas hydrophila]|uniref:hypothetical protein n=1 Tax=Aeromonas hydrophila TaxID=644 RepID=UPI001C2F1007
MHGFHHLLRLERLARGRRLIQLAFTLGTPAIDLGPPGLQCIGVGQLTPLHEADHLVDHGIGRTDDRHIGAHGLGDRARVDVDVDDLGR